uniref:FLYWCH-type domain-containing protein n=1 Tax=Anopheles christyi TaxID=43041 RepID=A0A182JNK5_9DIPT
MKPCEEPSLVDDNWYPLRATPTTSQRTSRAPQFTYKQSQRSGRQLLVVNGIHFFRNRQRNGKQYWKCNQYYKCKCPCIVLINEATARLSIKHSHNHETNACVGADGAEAVRGQQQTTIHHHIASSSVVPFPSRLLSATGGNTLNPHIEIYTTKSFRGRPAIIVDKQKYLLMSENSKRIVWRCSSMATEKLKCPARIIQYKETDQYTFPSKSTHQHAPLKRYKNISSDTHDTTLRFRTSQKGKLQLSYGGFYYCMEKKINQKEYWRCIYYTTKIKCHGRLHRYDNKYTTTQRGRTMLIFSGYKFVENRQSKRNIFWRCARYVKHGCRAACVTSKNCTGDDQSIRLTAMHESYSLYHDSTTTTAGGGEEQEHELELIGGQFHAGNMLRFGVSQRGAKKLIYDRYEYIKDREFPLSTNWRCALFKRYNCRARAITKVKNGKTFVRLTNHGHNHTDKEYRKTQKLVYE